jgi:hypothetical protein
MPPPPLRFSQEDGSDSNCRPSPKCLQRRPHSEDRFQAGRPYYPCQREIPEPTVQGPNAEFSRRQAVQFPQDRSPWPIVADIPLPAQVGPGIIRTTARAAGRKTASYDDALDRLAAGFRRRAAVGALVSRPCPGGGLAWPDARHGPSRPGAAATLQRGPAYSGGPFFAAMSGFTEGMGAVRQPGDRSRSAYSPDPPASRRRYSAPLPCRPAIRRAGSDRLQPARP